MQLISWILWHLTGLFFNRKTRMLCNILFQKIIRQITYTWILTGIVGLAFCFFDNASSYEWFHCCREPLISFYKPRKGRRSGLQNFLEFVTFFLVFLAFFVKRRCDVRWQNLFRNLEITASQTVELREGTVLIFLWVWFGSKSTAVF